MTKCIALSAMILWMSGCAPRPTELFVINFDGEKRQISQRQLLEKRSPRLTVFVVDGSLAASPLFVLVKAKLCKAIQNLSSEDAALVLVYYKYRIRSYPYTQCVDAGKDELVGLIDKWDGSGDSIRSMPNKAIKLAYATKPERIVWITNGNDFGSRNTGNTSQAEFLRIVSEKAEKGYAPLTVVQFGKPNNQKMYQRVAAAGQGVHVFFGEYIEDAKPSTKRK